MTCEVKWKKIHESAQLPCKAKFGDSGFDVYAVEDFVIHDNITVLVKTGLQLAYITPGFELQVRNRSGNAVKGVLINNSPGTVDNGYRGEVCVIMSSNNFVFFKKGERIGQLVPSQVAEATMEWSDKVEQTERAGGGFGSTGN